MAHAILISVKYRKVLNTTIPMETIERFRKGGGYPIPVDREEIKRYFETIDPDKDHTHFMDFYEDFVIESDAHGSLSAHDVVFDPKRERGYYFHLYAW